MKLLVKFVILVCVSTTIRAELKLLNVVFRHGDRAPDVKGVEAYPKDPYANRKFFPIGGGGLTNTGKVREYRLGQFLRKKYGKFLGPMYYKGVVSARSTFVERTMQSLQLVLAALYPPKGNQTWNQYVNWQPIPTNYKPRLDDILMNGQECIKYLEALERVRNSPEFQKRLSSFRPLMKNLTVETGKVINSTIDMYYLYHGLAAAESMNLKLPKWSNGIYPYGKLYDGVLLEYELFSYNDEMKRRHGGMYLRKFTDDMTAACEDKLEEPRKIFLYGGHEFSVAAVLLALNLYKPHIPRYSSAVIVELHKENGKCFVKVKYYRGLIRPTDKDKSIMKDLTVPGCSQKSSLTNFKNVLKNHIATNDDIMNCNKRLLPEFLKTHKNMPLGTTDTILVAIEEEKKSQHKLE